MKMSKTLESAAKSTMRVSGYTHKFYKYPARFSPQLVRAAIEEYSQVGDIVLDPFVGGGTSIVEASVLGRRGVGIDISNLAVFVSKVKTSPLSDRQLIFIDKWINRAAETKINVWVNRPAKWQSNHYLRNVNTKQTWRLRNFLEILIHRIAWIDDENVASFLRCCILSASQWAFDGKKVLPSLNEFRAYLKANSKQMMMGMGSYSNAINTHIQDSKYWPDGDIAKVIRGSAINTLNNPDSYLDKVDLVVMSPPYPGIHVLYHRWQIKGRRETPLPFWFTGQQDGKGPSYYTMGTRFEENHQTYFDQMRLFYSSLKNIISKNAKVVQLVGFQNQSLDLERYLKIMQDAGFHQISPASGRNVINRSVPNRKWYTANKDTSSGATEFLLVHRH